MDGISIQYVKATSGVSGFLGKFLMAAPEVQHGSSLIPSASTQIINAQGKSRIAQDFVEFGPTLDIRLSSYAHRVTITQWADSSL
jgi:hypothetical protein